jgi:hypothetical protein
MSGWKVCEQHSNGCLAPLSSGGICGLKLGRGKKCKVHGVMVMEEDQDVQQLTCGVGGCSINMNAAQKCSCPSCPKPRSRNSDKCLTHLVQRCQEKFAIVMRNKS